MTIDRKDLEFLLSHFEPSALPRRISTFANDEKYRGKQYPAFTIEYMLERFKEANELDCKVNAYRYLGQKYQSWGNGNGNGHGKTHDPKNFFNYEYNNDQLTRDAVARQILQELREVHLLVSVVHCGNRMWQKPATCVLFPLPQNRGELGLPAKGCPLLSPSFKRGYELFKRTCLVPVLPFTVILAI